MSALIRTPACGFRALFFSCLGTVTPFGRTLCNVDFTFQRSYQHYSRSTLIANGLKSKGRDLRKMSASPSPAESMTQRMVWVDLEMTGLDIEKDQIIEMACIITDSDLNILAEGPNLIISQPNELLESMSDWCKEHHGKSGLTQAVRDSKITLRQAEYEFLSFIRQHTPPGHCPLAGNSVHADKRFLDKYMPQFMRHLHYRIVDVSTVKELCRRWFPEDYRLAPQKRASHRALDDIHESIKELKYYRANVFKAELEKKRKIVENGDKTCMA
ncbi:small fragment nuclease isoform X2 [Electrophorus electricus]|uniref:Oligoribonuclease, mitochondrial n=1 Tax=Electrophorus electricus TaxID=8005 RepID=A0A4W4FFQ7_ELEEL|nr:small fragment nuclease isoform X2 [Electrophorus electricus]